MARVYSYVGFDMTDFNLSNLWNSAWNTDLLDNSNLTLDGATYRDVYAVDWTDGWNTLATVFGGPTIATNSSGEISGGTVTGYVEYIWDGFQYLAMGGMQGISISASRLYAAARTSTTDDDFQLLTEALAGNDVFHLSFGDDVASGLAGNDTLIGRAGTDLLLGGDGNDLIFGGTESDFLAGEAGNDNLQGQGGDDLMTLDAGNDRVEAGYGYDTLVIDGNAGANINLGRTTAQNTGYGMDTIIGVEHAVGARGNDRIVGTAGVNHLTGYTGHDELTGLTGNDVLNGGDGFDLLLGGGNNDLLLGGIGQDSLEGGYGRDTLDAGNDGHVDLFIFRNIGTSTPGGQRDQITSFDSGEDRLDLRQIDANSRVAGDQAFRMSDAGPAANSVWLFDNGANLVLRADVNGDSRPDFEIQLTGLEDLVARDLML